MVGCLHTSTIDGIHHNFRYFNDSITCLNFLVTSFILINGINVNNVLHSNSHESLFYRELEEKEDFPPTCKVTFQRQS